MDEQIRSAELEVVKTPIVSATIVEPALPAFRTPTGKRFTHGVIMQDGRTERIRFSVREMKFLKAYLETGNISASCREIGISHQTAHNYLKKDHIKRYIEYQRDRACKAADLTIDKVAATFSAAMSGEEISAVQLAAATAASKFLRPSVGPGANITVNQQNNYAAPSAYAGLDQAELIAQMKKNLLELED